MEVSLNNCLDLVADRFSDFTPVWNSFKLENKMSKDMVCGTTLIWGDTSFAGGMNKFSDYAVDLLIQNDQNSSLIKDIFKYVEYLFVNGDEDVKDAVATCFLENILNITPKQIDPKRYVGYLGSASREY